MLTGGADSGDGHRRNHSDLHARAAGDVAYLTHFSKESIGAQLRVCHGFVLGDPGTSRSTGNYRYMSRTMQLNSVASGAARQVFWYLMSKEQKVIDRLLSRPTDYEWRELESLMASFGYRLEKAGGSARKFIHNETKALSMIHERHPRKVLKHYQTKDAIDFLKQEKHIK
jgi:hypothetical protein